jgi:hypothetical protein
VYYIRVTPSSGSGTYKIGVDLFIPPDNHLIWLDEENTWANGNLAANGQQWFSFYATSSNQYIHVSFGSLTQLYIKLYDYSGTEVGSVTSLYGSTRYISRSLTAGMMYFINVTPYNSIISGTYRIAFNTSSTAP